MELTLLCQPDTVMYVVHSKDACLILIRVNLQGITVWKSSIIGIALQVVGFYENTKMERQSDIK
jgi:hypothetical protein